MRARGAYSSFWLPARRTGSGIPAPRTARSGGFGLGGRLGLALIDPARGQVTRSATFWEPGPRWLPRPGQGRTRSRGGLDSPGEQSCPAGALGHASSETAGPTCWIHGSEAGRSVLGDASPFPGWQADPAAPHPRSPTKGPAAAGGGPGGGAGAASSSRAQSCGVALPRRRGAGSAGRGISPAQG